jgi:ribosome-binding protein aMBF1 (putative translation factor)
MAGRPPSVGFMGDSARTPITRGDRIWAEHVGNRIRDLREMAALTQAQLARAAGMLQSHISRLENADGKISDQALRRIARALKVPVHQIDPCALSGCPAR